MVLLLQLLAVLAGTCLATQSAINADLARRLGHPVLGAAVSFSAGLIALAAIAIGLGLRPPNGPALRAIPPHLWIVGGLLGITYMISANILIPRLGVAVLVSLVVAGQMATALLLDQSGLLGVAIRPLTLTRAAGAVLLVLGVTLMTRR